VTSFILRFLDADGNGKVEIADLGGLVGKLAGLRAGGAALINAIVAMAALGQVTTPAGPISAEDVIAAWEKAKEPYLRAAAAAKADIGADV
jgi:hypothetical protein